MVHQLEAGSVNISNDSIEKLAVAYGTPKEMIVAALVREKYRVDPTRASLLNVEVLSLDGVADWESQVEADDLWIVTPSFVDRKHPGMRQAVLQRLRKGTNVAFFVPEPDCRESGTFTDYWHRLRLDLEPAQLDRLKAHRLSEEELRWVTSSFVIANARSLIERQKDGVEKIPYGYTILLRDDGDGKQSAFGFRMSDEELRKKAFGIYHWLETHPDIARFERKRS
jgi:hypothetical protein